MLAVVLALTAAIGYGGSDFAAGLASRSAPVIQITLLASVISGVIVAAALPFAASPGPNAAALAWGFVAAPAYLFNRLDRGAGPVGLCVHRGGPAGVATV